MKFRVSNNDLSEIQERLDQTKEGSKFTLEIKRAWTYSQQQQGYYRGVCIKMIADYCWYKGVQWFYVWDNEIIMDWYDYVHWLIKGLHKRRTSTDCNVEEYAQLIDTAITLWQSLGINIPPPAI